MVAISKDSKLVTLINVFTVEPEKQKELLDVLTQATEKTMRHLPGFISASLHRGLDGTKVVNYAQWRSMEELQAMQKNPEVLPHLKRAATLVTKFEPALYAVEETIVGDVDAVDEALL